MNYTRKQGLFARYYSIGQSDYMHQAVNEELLLLFVAKSDDILSA